MNIAQAKANITISDFLARMGRPYASFKGGEYWYHSPLPDRDDSTPSFKTDRTNRLWFDQGTKQGGGIIELAMLMFDCDESGALRELSRLYKGALFDQVDAPAPQREGTRQPKSPGLPLFDHTARESGGQEREQIEILPISSKGLYWYLHYRGIDPRLAKRYVKEMRYRSDDKTFYMLAFASDEGGYELRNGVGVTEGKQGFKGAHGPKAITTLHPEKATPGGSVSVFEGFFDFLAALSYYDRNEPSTPVIVMNSAAMTERTAAAIERLGAGRVHLYLDCNKTGQDAAQAIREALPNVKVEDRSGLYAAYVDFNEFWMKEGKQARLAKQPHLA